MAIDVRDNDFTGISPCKGCEYREINQNRCIDTCERLAAYRIGDPWGEKPAVKITKDAAAPKKTDREIIMAIEDDLEATGKTGGLGAGVHQATETINDDLCEIPDCTEPAKIRGLCAKDYDLWFRGVIKHPRLGEFKYKKTAYRPRKRAKKVYDECRIDECSDNATKRGLCQIHYRQWRKGSIEHPDFGVFAKLKAVKHPVEPKQPRKDPATKPSQSLDIITLDLGKYPQIRVVVLDAANKLLLPSAHIIMTLVGEAIAGRGKRE